MITLAAQSAPRPVPTAATAAAPKHMRSATAPEPRHLRFEPTPLQQKAWSAVDKGTRAELDGLGVGWMDQEVGGKTFAGLLRDSIRFRVDRTDAENLKLVPDSLGARTALKTPQGQAVKDLLEGSIKVLKNQGSDPQVSGVTLAQDWRTTAMESAFDSVRALRRNPDDMFGGNVPSTPAEAKKFIKEESAGVHAHHRLAGAWHDPRTSWLTITPSSTNIILRQTGVVGGRGNYDAKNPERSEKLKEYAGEMLVHELQHSVSPNRRGTPRPLKWFEEGTAETMSTTRPARREYRRLIDAAGETPEAPSGKPVLPAPIVEKVKSYQKQDRSTMHTNYDNAIKSVRKLVKLAGVDTGTIAGQKAAALLLQKDSLSDNRIVKDPDGSMVAVPIVPHNLAIAIAKEQGISQTQVVPIVDHLKKLGTNPEKLGEVVAEIMKLKKAVW